MVALPIYSITPFTLLDYPDKTACIIWFAGCNMRCLYCYNTDIVDGKGKMSYDEALQFLVRRKGLLDGVVLSGGECTLHKKLPDFIAQIKNLGLKVKIDTNGSVPQLLESLVNDELIDYVALDFKAMPNTFNIITQSNHFKKFEKSLNMLIKKEIAFEVRTTVHTNLISKRDLESMTNYLEDSGYMGAYYVQFFRNDTPTLYPLGRSLLTIDYCNIETRNVKVVFRG
ncbi:MAG: anaerobic ribonucleoside-triphosphate reductase activating protein [Flavobacterium psychrophilum]|nr:MAG: anaerobic ribonucleoside-triphosphate reductase activating protein [Flavobacterium psychrophilum]